MKKKCFRTIISLLSFILFYYPTSAQNCYGGYKAEGDKYKVLAESQSDLNKRQANYTLARQQYQIAKNCSYLTNAQRVTLDQLLVYINEKLKVVVRLQPTIKRN